MKLLDAAGLLQDFGRVDDVVKVDLDKPILARLTPRGSQAAEGHIGSLETLFILILQN